jgi:hypothetical protein
MLGDRCATACLGNADLAGRRKPIASTVGRLPVAATAVDRNTPNIRKRIANKLPCDACAQALDDSHHSKSTTPSLAIHLNLHPQNQHACREPMQQG